MSDDKTLREQLELLVLAWHKAAAKIRDEMEDIDVDDQSEELALMDANADRLEKCATAIALLLKGDEP